MVIRSRTAVIFSLLTFALPSVAWGQDEQVGQQGAVWNLGELAPGAYPSTVTAINESCPGPHDFHVSLRGEAAEFMVIVGPTILTDIPPGSSKTSEVVFNLRSLAPGPHNEGQVAVRCVDCPPICSQDHDLLAVHLTITGDASSAPADAGVSDEPAWSGVDLMSLDPATASPPPIDDSVADLRWVVPEALDRMTTVEDAVDEGLAELEFTGTGRAGGEIFTVQITRRADTPFELGFPLGTLIVPDDDRYSTMMVGDDGAVALLDEVTTVVVSGYLLDPMRLPPPTAEPVDGADAPSWSVAPPPQSGPFADAMAFINAAYALAGNLSTAVPVDDYLQVVVQRSIWAEAAPDDFGEERLQQDILAQIGVVGKVATEDEVENASDDIWNDLSQVINMGKSR